MMISAFRFYKNSTKIELLFSPLSMCVLINTNQELFYQTNWWQNVRIHRNVLRKVDKKRSHGMMAFVSMSFSIFFFLLVECIVFCEWAITIFYINDSNFVVSSAMKLKLTQSYWISISIDKLLPNLFVQNTNEWIKIKAEQINSLSSSYTKRIL